MPVPPDVDPTVAFLAQQSQMSMQLMMQMQQESRQMMACLATTLQQLAPCQQTPRQLAGNRLKRQQRAAQVSTLREHLENQRSRAGLAAPAAVERVLGVPPERGEKRERLEESSSESDDEFEMDKVSRKVDLDLVED